MAILISIKPECVEKILNGEKTIEIRKTMPKCELPQKVYIYCTKKQHLYKTRECNEFFEYYSLEHWSKDDVNITGKVVAEFTLDKVDKIEICDPYIFRNGEQEDWWYFDKNACLNYEEMMSYIGYGNDYDGYAGENQYDIGYAWHISNLKVYEKPKELSEFKNMHYDFTKEHGGSAVCPMYERKKITRPPQSYMFVEDLEEV